jgi:DNA-binding transcriptional LysR family regulator
MFDHRLATFLTVCKTKNLTKAALILNLTQPAVTKQINYLEEYYGVALLCRQGRALKLTAAGRILYEYGKNMQSQAAVLERKLKNSAALAPKYIIGATLTIGEYILPYIIGKYKERSGLYGNRQSGSDQIVSGVKSRLHHYFQVGHP